MREKVMLGWFKPHINVFTDVVGGGWEEGDDRLSRNFCDFSEGLRKEDRVWSWLRDEILVPRW